MDNFIEIIGWIVAVLIVGSYFMNINGKVKSSSIIYIISNLIGGIFLPSTLLFIMPFHP
jgi:hypothetical protein